MQIFFCFKETLARHPWTRTNIEKAIPLPFAVDQLEPKHWLCEWRSIIPYFGPVKNLSKKDLEIEVEKSGLTEYLAKNGTLFKAARDLYTGMNDYMKRMRTEILWS